MTSFLVDILLNLIYFLNRAICHIDIFYAKAVSRRNVGKQWSLDSIGASVRWLFSKPPDNRCPKVASQLHFIGPQASEPEACHKKIRFLTG
jgi:hypothetical protein